MFFFESGTSTLKNTFADINETIANPNPVILTGSGRLPNVFFRGSAKVVLTDNDDVQIFERDPVSTSETGVPFSDFDSVTSYDISDIVTGSDERFYQSLVANNQDNDPVSSPSSWMRIDFVTTYNAANSYDIGEIATEGTKLFVSKTTLNQGNTPSSSADDWDQTLSFDNDFVDLKSGRKNYIINGNFNKECWQRGVNFVDPNGEYTSDRWLVDTFASASGVGTISQEAFTLGQTDVPNEPEFFFRLDQTTAMGAVQRNLQQRIEDVRTLAGTTCTVTFWAKIDSNKTFDVRLAQSFGTGGSPSTTVDTALGSAAITTAFQKFTFTVTLPSISGKTLGSDGNDFLGLEFLEQANTIFTLDIAQVQLEKGSVATGFEFRPIAEELALCHRYLIRFERTTGINNTVYLGAGHCFTTTTGRGIVNFPVEMRALPSVNSSSSAAAFLTNTGGAVIASTVISPSNPAKTGSNLDITVASGLIAGQGTELGLTASSWIEFDAEL